VGPGLALPEASATAAFAMGSGARDWVESLEGYEAFAITSRGADWQTSGFRAYLTLPGLQYHWLARVINEQAVIPPPQAGEKPVIFQPSVVQEMPDLHLTYRRDEIGEQPAVAAPPQALRAHHGRDIRVGLDEHLIGRGEKTVGPHMRRVTPEHLFSPDHVRGV